MRRVATWIAGWTVLATAAVGPALVPAVARADPHEVRVPLRDGQLTMAELTDLLPKTVADRLPAGSLDVRGLGGSLFVAALNASLGDGCHVDLKPDALVVRFDADKLPKDLDAGRVAVRTFTATAAPQATAALNKHFGLKLPKAVDGSRPMVVVIHGVDMTAADMASMDKPLAAAGYQTADFDYPPDGPIADDVTLLAKHLSAFHELFPAAKVELVAFSMGGLVARGYVEGSAYAGGVDRLIMIATPNHGSAWARVEVLAKARMTAEQAWAGGDWHPTWIITGGLCEAGRDMAPGSKFLTELNGHTRRPDVRYTIVTGDQDPARRWAAVVVGAPAKWVPGFAKNWWGVKQARSGLATAAADLRDKHADKRRPGDDRQRRPRRRDRRRDRPRRPFDDLPGRRHVPAAGVDRGAGEAERVNAE